MMYVNPFLACYANDNDALIPELWARESIAVLEENMVAGRLVHRDFENIIANFGDVVNTRKPQDGIVRRKTDADSIVYNDAVLTNVPVQLNQHYYAGFVIKDGERSKSLQDLISIHLVPTMKAVGNGIDRMILGRMAHELILTPQERVGRLNSLSSSNSKSTVLQARERLNRTLATPMNRNLVLAPGSETSLLETELFIKANERGDDGTALEQARLGMILGFETFMDQNVNGILDDSNRDTVDSVTSASIPAGATGALTQLDWTGYEVQVGSFIQIDGNDQPHWATAVTTSVGDTTDVTLNEAIKFDVASGARTRAYDPGMADGVYSAGHTEAVVIDDMASGKNLVVGQLVAFGTTGGTRHTYTIIEVEASTATSTTVLLDRPLDIAVADDEVAFPGPSGDFNLAFHRNAFSLVTRPLAAPDASMGARSFVAVHNNIAMRATMQYDIDAQGTKVVLDLLAGASMLDNALATLVLG